jgi:putative transcriptional regulator
MPLEDRVEKISRLVLVALLLATLAWATGVRAQAPAEEADAPLLLVAKRGLKDEFFGASILVAKPIGDGRHVGFVLNRPTPMTLGKLFPEHAPSQKVPDPVFLGGPLNTEFIFVLLQSSAHPGGGAMQLAPNLYVSADAKTVDQVIEADAEHARFFAGVVAWRPGELQEELKRGLWHVQAPDPALIMRKSTEGLWEELVGRAERRDQAI